MLNLQYIGEERLYEVNFNYINKNLIEVTGDFPVKSEGFILTRIGNPEAFTGDYSNYNTVYKYIDGGAVFSNDGSVYVEPLKVVTFNASYGGNLDGETRQEVYNYEELIIPTPIADNDYEFTAWVPEIPTSGEVDTNKSYTATFTSLLPPPEPEPTLEERVSTLEEENAMLASCVIEISEVVYA